MKLKGALTLKEGTGIVLISTFTQEIYKTTNSEWLSFFGGVVLGVLWFYLVGGE
jgi:hypothetical protein